MASVLLAPTPSPNGGPSLAIARVMSLLGDHGYSTASSFFDDWDLAIVNVGGGLRGFGILASGRRFLYRAAGYYLREVFDKAGRPWNWRFDLANILTRTYLRKASYVIFQSEYAKEILMRSVNAAVRRHLVVHNGIDLSRYAPSNKPRGRQFTIGAAGKMRHERVRDLVRLSERLNFGHRLLVVGAMQSEDHQRLVDAGKRSIGGVQMVGGVPAGQMCKYYQQMDVLVHLAAADVCPNVVVEALACGVPVVCHAYGGTAELIGDGGISIPGSAHFNSDEFLSRAAEAVDTIRRRQQFFGACARARAEQVLDIRHVAALYARSLDQVLAS